MILNQINYKLILKMRPWQTRSGWGASVKTANREWTQWTRGHTNLYLDQQLLPSCALSFFNWNISFFLSPVKMWILSSLWWRRVEWGGVYGTFLLIRGKCMISPLCLRPDPPRVASFRASHWNTLHPFMCIDVKFVHKTRHLLTLFVISTSFF